MEKQEIEARSEIETGPKQDLLADLIQHFKEKDHGASASDIEMLREVKTWLEAARLARNMAGFSGKIAGPKIVALAELYERKAKLLGEKKE